MLRGQMLKSMQDKKADTKTVYDTQRRKYLEEETRFSFQKDFCKSIKKMSAVVCGAAAPITCTGTVKQAQKMAAVAPKTCTSTAKQAQNKL